MKSLIKIVSFLLLLDHALTDDPIVELPAGKIRGREVKTYTGKSFYSFQEVPYAEPPVGFLRFQPPIAKKSWQDILNTTKNTKICYQVPKDDPMENEDCLYLNVYTPAKPGSEANLSVLFFIHGGGFVEGSGIFTTYGPQRLMDHEVVVVTINYRLGPFGFLSTGDKVLPGNNGLRDQNLALQWVQENIHLFGGDPSKVTIYGQSAGAASVTYHLLSKKSEGLFRAAYASSGTALCPWAYQRHARDYAYQTAGYIFNVTDSLTTNELKIFLSVVSAKVIDEASAKIPDGIGSDQMIEGFFFGPVIEPEYEDAFLTEKMYESFLNGRFTKVPTLFGLNAEEAAYRRIERNITDKVHSYENPIGNLVIEDFHITDEDRKDLAGQAIREIYTNGTLEDDLQSAVSYFSDVSFSKPVIRNAEIMANYTDVYFYQFSYQLRIFNVPIYLSVWHGAELYYVWSYQSIGIYTPENLKTSERIIKFITNFCKTLNPTPEKDPVLENIQLDKVTSESFPYIDIGDNLTIEYDPKKAAFSGWKKVYEEYGVRPFDTY